MSLLKLGKFLKAERRLKRVWLCFSCQSIPSQRTSAALLVCPQAGLVLCAAHGAAHGLTASCLTSWAWLLQLCCPLPCTDFQLCPKLPSQGVQHKPWASHCGSSFLLGWNPQPHMYCGPEQGKTPGELSKNYGFWVFKGLIPLNLEETQDLGLCSLSPWLHGKILSQQDAFSVLYSKADVFYDADVVIQEYISKAQNLVYWFTYPEHCRSLEEGHVKITRTSCALLQSHWRWPLFNQLRE